MFPRDVASRGFCDDHSAASVSASCWGAAGAWAMIDPYNRLSAFFVMHVLNHSYCFNVIHPTLRGLIYEGL